MTISPSFAASSFQAMHFKWYPVGAGFLNISLVFFKGLPPPYVCIKICTEGLKPSYLIHLFSEFLLLNTTGNENVLRVGSWK